MDICRADDNVTIHRDHSSTTYIIGTLDVKTSTYQSEDELIFSNGNRWHSLRRIILVKDIVDIDYEKVYDTTEPCFKITVKRTNGKVDFFKLPSYIKEETVERFCKLLNTKHIRKVY